MAVSQSHHTARTKHQTDTLGVLKAQEVLARYSDLLLRDFDLEDVRYDVCPFVLTRAECDDILGAQHSAATRIDKLIFVLGASAHKLDTFINAVAQKYAWLAKWMRMALRDESNDGKLETIREQIRRLRSQIPRLEALNVSRMSYLFNIQQVLKKLSPGECLMLTGDLVYGKKWLAIDACCNYTIMDHMDGRVYLVTLDKCHTDEDILERMVFLYSLLNPIAAQSTVYDDSTAHKIHVLKSLLIRELSTQPDALLVLCDVQCSRVLRSFALECKCMLTTRNKAMLDEWPADLRHDIAIADGFTAAESLALFARVLDIDVRLLPPEAEEIHTRCAGSPFIISLVASNLKDCHMTKQRWRMWVSKLNTNESTRHDPLRKIIEQSICDLPDGYAQLFYSLAIFGDNVKIPLSLLQAYWGKSRPDVEQIVQKLDRLYLVERIYGQCAHDATDEREFCLLKYHYYSFLSHYHTDAEMQQMHRKLIQSYDIPQTKGADFADPEVCHRLNDRYFYFYIGQHLRQAGRTDAFAPLYLNLSFLEQKLRCTGLPNTIGNLATFRRVITANAPGRIALLNELLDFLPNVEEMLIKSADTTLLQYALNTGGALQAEARRQADAAPHRVLFVGADHVNRHRRQIIALPQRPTYTRFCDPDTALFAFENHHIYLADLSSEFNIQPSLFVGHKAAIVDIKLLSGDDGGGFLSEFVSLDLDGVCHVWSLDKTPIHRRRTSSSSSSSVRQSRTDSFNRHTNTHTFKQTIEASARTKDRIRCMALVQRTGSNAVIFGTAEGQLLVYDRTRDGLQRDIELKTSMRDIRAIQTTATSSRSLVVLTGNGSMWLYDTKTTSSHLLGRLSETETKVVAMHSLSGPAQTGGDWVAVVVFSAYILRVHISGIDGPTTPAIGVQLLSEETTGIAFSVLTDDRRYLVLGTERGIVVLDVRGSSGDGDGDSMGAATRASSPASQAKATAAAMLHGRSSDRIACVDVHSLDGDRYKYLLVCGTNSSAGEQLCYLYALEANAGGALTQLRPQLDHPSLVGGRRFGVMQTTGRRDDDWRVLAVDSLGRLQLRSSADGFVASALYDAVDGDVGAHNAVRCLTCCGDYAVLGCEDGTIRDNRNGGGVLMRLKGGDVTFVQCFADNGLVIVAGTPHSYRICTTAAPQPEIPSAPIRRCFVVANGAWLVVVKETAGFVVHDLRDQRFAEHQPPGRQLKLGDCDLIDDCLSIATTGELHVWRIDGAAGSVDAAFRRRPSMSVQLLLSDGPATAAAAVCAVKLSAQRDFVAVGFGSGTIHLYRLGAHSTQFVHELRSHRTAVRALLFAPWPLSGGQPLVLASMASELCFWDCTEADNNPTQLLRVDGLRRHSKRFAERASPAVTPDTDDGLLLLRQVAGPWSGAAGDRRKPTLLACIKFVGGVAEQLFANGAFTQFLTIDDAGEIYHYTLRAAAAAEKTPVRPSPSAFRRPRVASDEQAPTRLVVAVPPLPLNGHYS